MIGSLQEYREALEQGNGDRLCTLDVYKRQLLVLVSRVFLGAVFSGQMMTLMYSLGGGLLCWLAMVGLKQILTVQMCIRDRGGYDPGLRPGLSGRPGGKPHRRGLQRHPPLDVYKRQGYSQNQSRWRDSVSYKLLNGSLFAPRRWECPARPGIWLRCAGRWRSLPPPAAHTAFGRCV